MEEKLMSFLQFCEVMKNEILSYLPENYRDGNHDVVVEEIKDNYNHITTFLRMENRKENILNAPPISVDAAYENYKQIGNKDKIFQLVADKYDKLYSEYARAEYEKYDGRADFDVHKLFAKYVSAEEAAKDRMNSIYVAHPDGMTEEEYVELHLLVSSNENEYTSCKLTAAQVHESNISEDELIVEAVKNVPRLLPLTIRTEKGNPKFNLSDIYYVVKPTGTTWSMYGTDVFDELATKISHDLLISSVDDNTRLVLSAESIKDMEDSLDTLKEMRLSGTGLAEERFVLYDRSNKDYIMDQEEVKAAVSKIERKSKSLFNR